MAYSFRRGQEMAPGARIPELASAPPPPPPPPSGAVAKAGEQMLAEAISNAVIVRPGDTLIVRIQPDISRQRFEEFADSIKARLPEVKVVVLAAEQLLVYRPDGES